MTDGAEPTASSRGKQDASPCHSRLSRRRHGPRGAAPASAAARHRPQRAAGGHGAAQAALPRSDILASTVVVAVRGGSRSAVVLLALASGAAAAAGSAAAVAPPTPLAAAESALAHVETLASARGGRARAITWRCSPIVLRGYLVERAPGRSRAADDEGARAGPRGRALPLDRRARRARGGGPGAVRAAPGERRAREGDRARDQGDHRRVEEASGATCECRARPRRRRGRMRPDRAGSLPRLPLGAAPAARAAGCGGRRAARAARPRSSSRAPMCSASSPRAARALGRALRAARDLAIAGAHGRARAAAQGLRGAGDLGARRRHRARDRPLDLDARGGLPAAEPAGRSAKDMVRAVHPRPAQRPHRPRRASPASALTQCRSPWITGAPSPRWTT